MGCKTIKFTLFMVIINFFLNAIPTATLAYEQENITNYANFSVSAVLQDGHALSNINDGQERSGMATKQEDTTWDFPVYLTISFGERLAELSELRLGSMYGKFMGIKTFDVEYKVNDDWKTLRSGIEPPWRYTTVDYEMLAFHFHDKVISNEFRIKITEAYRRQFRLDEIELYGQMKGLANPIDIQYIKPLYIATPINKNVKIPTEIEAFCADGTHSLTAVWEDTKYSEVGTYRTEGAIQYYEEKPMAIIDAYDVGANASAYDGNWGREAVVKAVRSGTVNGIVLNPSRILNRGDCAKLIFRKLIKEFSQNNAVLDDVEKSNPFYEMFGTVADKGCFIISSEFLPDKNVTRMDMLRAIVTATGYQLEENVEIVYTDIAPKDEQVVKIALEHNMITPGESFRPDDGINLAEALVMLSGAAGGGLNVEFKDNDALVRNPDMGLFSYYYDNDPNNYDVAYGADELFDDVPEVSVVFMRFAWAFLEPKNGEYDFSLIDSIINRYAKTGRQIGFRVTTAETGFPYATPSWVFDEGCKYYRWDNTGVNANGANLMVDFNDPIFLKYQRRFTEELAKRYDGNPNIAFVEIGNVGVWGEGHTYTSGIMYTLDTAKECLDMYIDNFHETYIHINNLTQGYPQLEDYAIEHGVGWRNDSFYVNAPQLHTYDNQVMKYWETNTVAMEPQHWDKLVGWVGGDDCIESFTTTHPTFFGLHGYLGNIMETDAEFVKKAANRIGYRFVPETIEMSDKINAHQNVALNILWKNNGCAPSYKNYYTAITLKNKNGSIETVMVDPNFTMTDVRPDSNEPQQASLRLNAILSGGEYEAYLSVGTLDGTPKIELPIDGNDGNKRYYIGNINVREDYEIKAIQINGSNALDITFSVNEDVFGEYKYFASAIAMIDPEMGTTYVNGAIAISLDDAKDAIVKAMNEKTSVSFSTREFTPKGEQLENIKGRKLNVVFQLYNDGIAKGDNAYMLVGRNGQRPLIGTAVFDEQGRMTFMPAK